MFGHGSVFRVPKGTRWHFERILNATMRDSLPPNVQKHTHTHAYESSLGRTKWWICVLCCMLTNQPAHPHLASNTNAFYRMQQLDWRPRGARVNQCDVAHTKPSAQDALNNIRVGLRLEQLKLPPRGNFNSSSMLSNVPCSVLCLRCVTCCVSVRTGGVLCLLSLSSDDPTTGTGMLEQVFLPNAVPKLRHTLGKTVSFFPSAESTMAMDWVNERWKLLCRNYPCLEIIALCSRTSMADRSSL